MTGFLFYSAIITGSRKAITVIFFCESLVLMAPISESRTLLKKKKKKHTFTPRKIDHWHQSTK